MSFTLITLIVGGAVFSLGVFAGIVVAAFAQMGDHEGSALFPTDDEEDRPKTLNEKLDEWREGDPLPYIPVSGTPPIHPIYTKDDETSNVIRGPWGDSTI